MRKRKWRLTPAEKEAAAKQEIKDAYAANRGALPRTPPTLIRDRNTKKWTHWQEVDAADRTPDALVPAVEALARTLNAAVDGTARRAGRLEHSKQDEAYQAAIVRFRAVNYEHVLRPPFNKSRPVDIEKTAAQHGIKLPSSGGAFVRYLRRNPIS